MYRQAVTGEGGRRSVLYEQESMYTLNRKVENTSVQPLLHLKAISSSDFAMPKYYFCQAISTQLRTVLALQHKQHATWTQMSLPQLYGMMIAFTCFQALLTQRLTGLALLALIPHLASVLIGWIQVKVTETKHGLNYRYEQQHMCITAISFSKDMPLGDRR